MTNNEKAQVIDALREKYELCELLGKLKLSRSSYYYTKNHSSSDDKYRDLRAKVKDIFKESNGTYGYRRIHAEILKSYGRVSEKIIRCIMRDEKLKVVCVSLRRYSSYEGEISPAAPNLVARNFHAEAPNQLIVTDITEFHIPAGKIYLSPAIDCFDGMPIAWTIGKSPTAELTNTMLDSVISQLKPW